VQSVSTIRIQSASCRFSRVARLFEQRGVTPDLAMQVSRQMSAKDVLSVHASAELGMDPEAVTNPAAAAASLVAFELGLLPIAPVGRRRPGITATG